MKSVLIIEDDRNIVDLLDIHLKDLDCTTSVASDGQLGLEKALDTKFDLIILDIMLDKIDGLEICRRIRANEITTPVLMLTAKAEEIDRVLGLETGADDYLTKPFSVREFIARVKAIFRREKILKEQINKDNKKTLKYGDLFIDQDKRKVLLNDKRIELTPKEFDLLFLLASNPGKSYTREQILSLVWGYEFDGYEHTVNSHINRLRAKIEPDLSKPRYILTLWGVGYRFTDEEDIVEN
jgi:two-component system, OmpR family, alkaline phosphatase synthesis response regulator PhoP